MLGLYLNKPRVHGLLNTFLKYNKLKLYKGNSPSDFLGKRHYATRRGCHVLILIARKCVGCGMYKIVVSEAANDMFTLANTLYSTPTRGHPYKPYLHNSFIDVRKHFFCERMSCYAMNDRTYDIYKCV